MSPILYIEHHFGNNMSDWIGFLHGVAIKFSVCETPIASTW